MRCTPVCTATKDLLLAAACSMEPGFSQVRYVDVTVESKQIRCKLTEESPDVHVHYTPGREKIVPRNLN